MRRSFRWLAGLAAALMVICGLEVPDAAAAPVKFRLTPLIGWSTNGPVYEVLVVGDTVYAGGAFSTVRPSSGGATIARANLAAFDVHTGALRTAFVAGTDGPVRALASDGNKLFVGGSYTTIGSVNRNRLAAVDLATGAVDGGFVANVNSNVYALAAHGNRLYVGGTFSMLGGQTRNRVGSVATSNGAVHPTFNPNADSAVRAIEVSPDGETVYVGGQFSVIGGSTRSYIAPVSSSTGGLLPLFFQFSQYGQVIDLDLSPSGNQIFAALGDLENQAISWSTITGQRLWRQVADGDTQAVHYHHGNVYFGFHEGFGNSTAVRMLVADANTGALENTYRPTINSYFGVWSIDSHDDALVVGGEFTNYAGVATQGVAIVPRSSSDPVPPEPPPTAPSVTSASATTIGLSWPAGSDDVGVGGYRVLRDGVEAGYTTTTSFEDTNLAHSSVYRYTVQTVDVAGNLSAPSAPVDGATTLTVLPQGSTWRYLDNGSDQGTAWRAPGFNDSGWAQGPAQLGYGDGDEATVVSFGGNPSDKYLTTYFRRAFQLEAPLATALLRLLRDDGAVVYLNGTEIYRVGMPTGTVTSRTYANVAVNGAQEGVFLQVPINPALLVTGTNTIAVEIHQNSRGDSDISFDLAIDGTRAAAPSSPTNLHATSVTATSATLAWNAPSGNVAGYRLYRNGSLVASPTGTSATDSGLVSATEYSYTVTAVDAEGRESAASTPAVITTTDVIPPSTPTGLTATLVAASRVVLTWEPATDNVSVSGYQVLRNGVPLAGVGPVPGYTDTAVTPLASYSYTVRALDAAGNQSQTSAALAVTTPDGGDLAPPSTPTNLTVTGRSSTAISISWSPSDDDTGVVGYIVTRDGVDLPMVPGTSFTDTGRSPGTAYTYSVRAVDGAANVSEPSTAISVTTHATTESVFGRNSQWRYTDDGVDRGTAWRAPGYDDSTWKVGAGQLGYGDGDETTVMFNGGPVETRFLSHYFRRSFSITDAASVDALTLSLLRDDGAIVYVNGVEVLRVGMPDGAVNYRTYATEFRGGGVENQYTDYALPPGLLTEGTNVIAVQVHQNTRTGDNGDLGFDAALSVRYP